jgi:O-methyltransferase
MAQDQLNRWVADLHHTTGLGDIPKFREGMGSLLASFGPVGAFSGDSMVTWGKSLSFLDQSDFIQAFTAAQPDVMEQSIVWRVYVQYWAAMRGLELTGDFVEAACYRGFSARVLCSALRFATLDRHYWLYDLFEHPAGTDHQELPDHGPELFEQVRARFSDVPNVRILQGRMPDVMAGAEPSRIAFLHLDMNSVDAEIGTLERLWDRISEGAVIVLDDYGWLFYRSQKKAHDEWFRQRGKMVLELPTGQGIVIR